jgi:hypothetical protein
MTAKLAEFCREKDKHLIFNDDEYKVFWRNNPPIDAKTCKCDAFLGLFFDGTNNNKYRDLPKRAAKDDEAAKTNSASNSRGQTTVFDTRFGDQIAQALGRRTLPGNSGRPKKPQVPDSGDLF